MFSSDSLFSFHSLVIFRMAIPQFMACGRTFQCAVISQLAMFDCHMINSSISYSIIITASVLIPVSSDRQLLSLYSPYHLKKQSKTISNSKKTI